MAALHLPQAQPLTRAQLDASKNLELPDSENGYWSVAYARGWPKHWDYVLYFHTPQQAGLDGLPVCALKAYPGFTLYQVGRCSQKD